MTDTQDRSETDRTEKRDDQIQNIYAEIGRFIVEYENAVYALRVLAWFTLDLINKPLGQRLAQIATAELSNKSLRDATLAAIRERYKPDDADARLIEKVFQRLDRLEQEHRNPIVHSTWFIGYGNETTTDWDSASQMRMRVRNGELRIGRDRKSAADFEAAADEAQEVGKMLWYVHVCLTTGMPVAGKFRLDAQGQVRRVDA